MWKVFVWMKSSFCFGLGAWKTRFFGKNYQLDCEKCNIRARSYFLWKETEWKLNWLSFPAIERKIGFWAKVFLGKLFSAQLAEIPSICLDVNFGETVFLMIVKVFEFFWMSRSKKQLVYNKSKISFDRVVENENGIWRVQRNISISFLLFS